MSCQLHDMSKFLNIRQATLLYQPLEYSLGPPLHQSQYAMAPFESIKLN
jgi:hypothetical protein